MKLVTSIEDAGLLIKVVSETMKNEGKNKKVCYYSMLLCTLGAR